MSAGQFIRVKKWSWVHFFSRQQLTFTDVSVTEEQFRQYLDSGPGAGGNWDPKSISVSEIDIKAKNKSLIVQIKP